MRCSTRRAPASWRCSRSSARIRRATRRTLRRVARRARAASPFLVVSELFMTETAQRATLVLPAKGRVRKVRNDDRTSPATCCRSTPSLQAPGFRALGSRDAVRRSPISSEWRCRRSGRLDSAVIVDRVAKAAAGFHARRRRFAASTRSAAAAETNGERHDPLRRRHVAARSLAARMRE